GVAPRKRAPPKPTPPPRVPTPPAATPPPRNPPPRTPPRCPPPLNPPPPPCPAAHVMGVSARDIILTTKVIIRFVFICLLLFVGCLVFPVVAVSPPRRRAARRWD